MWNFVHKLITETTTGTLRLGMWNFVHKLIIETTTGTLRLGMWNVELCAEADY